MLEGEDIKHHENKLVLLSKKSLQLLLIYPPLYKSVKLVRQLMDSDSYNFPHSIPHLSSSN